MAALTAGTLNSPPQPLQIEALAKKYCDASNPIEKNLFFSRLLLGCEPASGKTPSLLELLTQPQAHLH
jgi:hypothetical protein